MTCHLSHNSHNYLMLFYVMINSIIQNFTLMSKGKLNIRIKLSHPITSILYTWKSTYDPNICYLNKACVFSVFAIYREKENFGTENEWAF